MMHTMSEGKLLLLGGKKRKRFSKVLFTCSVSFILAKTSKLYILSNTKEITKQNLEEEKIQEKKKDHKKTYTPMISIL